MSLLHVQQIKANLLKLFSGLIDVSDYAKRSERERESAFLTRGLAAFALMHLADVDPPRAASAVTDGGQDNGIDAIHYDGKEKRLHLVQSKWKHSGAGSLGRGEVGKFIKGLKDLLNARFDRFNAKVNAKRSEIEVAITDANARFVLTAVYSGQDPLAQEPARDFEDLLREMNDPTELVVLQVLRQADIHSIIATGIKGAPINLEVVLSDWGVTSEPYASYYGHVAATDMARWWVAHHTRLLAPNLRMFLGSTEVNEGMLETLRNQPSNFWYFNNGITVLCSTISKKPIGGSSRDTGIFECADVAIVNGAQTVGSIATAYATHPDSVAKARVPIRLISLDHCPESFARDVTRYTNTQNRIERRDFVALDPNQDQLRTELQIEGVEYVYKSGGVVPPGRTGFDLPEATVALACSSDDVGLAMQAKREISKLWEEIDKTPYKALFNDALNGIRLWRLVQIHRAMETSLSEQYQAHAGRERMIPVHGNRLIAWYAFRAIPGEDGVSPKLLEQVKGLTVRALEEVTRVTNTYYPDSYLATLFKNLTKCRDIVARLPALTLA